MPLENVETVRRGLETLREALERRDFDSVFDADVLADDVSGFQAAAFLDPTAIAGATVSANTCARGQRTSTICRSISRS